MSNNHENPPHPKLKIKLTNGEVLFFGDAQISITPNAAFLYDRERPNTTRIFPFANIIELEIPGKMILSKIQKPGIV